MVYSVVLFCRVIVAKLTTTNHCSDSAGLKYVYPVISRRVGGLSIGINFNTNNACNWRCIYCQVPDLTVGVAPAMDFQLLEDELRFFLQDVLHGDFYRRFQVDADKQVIKDIAIAGNGEPTSMAEFARAVDLIGQLATEAGVFPGSDYVLITNGSLLHQAHVQQGLKVLSGYGGQVWFKLDSATKAGRSLFNNTGQSLSASVENLILSAKLCPTKLQTCLFDVDGQGLLEQEKIAYLEVLRQLKTSGCGLRQVLLYTIARPSQQPEALRIAPLPMAVLENFADEIRMLGYEVSVSG